MILQYLPINKKDIFKRPEIFLMEIEESIYEISVSYNVYDEDFYFSMYEEVTGDPIIEGRRIVFGNDLLENIKNDHLPNNTSIIVVNARNSLDGYKVTKDNFMEEIKPYLITERDNDE